MTWLGKLVLAGAVVELVTALIALVAGGAMAMVAVFVGGAPAMGAQVAAVSLLRPVLLAPAAEFNKRWAIGMAMRGASFVVLGALMVGLKHVLPPLWLGAGYLAVLLTLLLSETKFLK